MRNFLVGIAATLVAGVSSAGVIWVPLSLSVPTMGGFALAALAIGVGIVAARYTKKK